ncbi:MAG: energy transducer TonB [Pseudoxanthomonas sp.]
MSHDPISAKSRLFVPALLALALTACSKNEADTAAPAVPAPATQAAGQQAPAITPETAVAPGVQAMGSAQLREAASKALAENRIYSPGGNNAMEYYLSLRDKEANDPAVNSALTDLLPYTVIAAEQSLAREDLTEAQRLAALIEKADAQAPALPRLKQSLANAEKTIAQREVNAEATAKADADKKKKETERVAAQAAEQKQAAEALAAQQRDQAAKAAEAERAAEQQRQAAAQAPAPVPVPAAPAPSRAMPAAATPTLRVMAAPAPRYPADALRAGTSGEVLVEITVGVDGSVTNARVVRAEPIRIFDREALNAVRRWKFEPVDAPVTTRRTIAFNSGGH